MNIKYVADFYICDDEIDKLDDISQEIYDHFIKTACAFRMNCETCVQDDKGQILYD